MAASWEPDAELRAAPWTVHARPVARGKFVHRGNEKLYVTRRHVRHVPPRRGR